MALTHRTLSHGIGVLTLSSLLAAPSALAETEAKGEQKGSLALESLVVTGKNSSGT